VSTPEILSALADHAFCQGMSEQHRIHLASGAGPFTASPGEYLGREGDPAQKFYLIESGHVAIGTHLGEYGEAPIQTVGPGEVVGWSWLLPPHRWQFDARALDAVRGLAFDAAWLRNECEQDHELGYHLLRRLVAAISGRLAATRLQRLDIYR
jgi:CRP-like cAMP-binding protein